MHEYIETLKHNLKPHLLKAQKIYFLNQLLILPQLEHTFHMRDLSIFVFVCAFFHCLKWAGFGWEKGDVTYFRAPIKAEQHQIKTHTVLVKQIRWVFER